MTRKALRRCRGGRKVMAVPAAPKAPSEAPTSRTIAMPAAHSRPRRPSPASSRTPPTAPATCPTRKARAARRVPSRYSQAPTKSSRLPMMLSSMDRRRTWSGEVNRRSNRPLSRSGRENPQRSKAAGPRAWCRGALDKVISRTAATKPRVKGRRRTRAQPRDRAEGPLVMSSRTKPISPRIPISRAQVLRACRMAAATSTSERAPTSG
jgi:hypothetical protein